MNTLEEALTKYKKNIKTDHSQELVGTEVQLVVRENNKKPGQPIFVREDGKVGFPTINSVNVEIGDVVKATIFYEEKTYFLVEVYEVCAAD